MTSRLIEVCVDGVTGLDAAVAGGADRIELCAALPLGGLTPPTSLMRRASASRVPVFAMVRPRAGDFVYETGEIELMMADIDDACRCGLAGVVLGATLPDGRLDRPALRRLLEHALSLDLDATLHRAFDMAPGPEEALEEAIDLGFRRILTSGGAATALEGLDVLVRLQERAAGRIELMPGSGVRPETIGAIAARLPVAEIHASASVAAMPGSARATLLGFEMPDMKTTSAEAVQALREAWERACQAASP